MEFLKLGCKWRGPLLHEASRTLPKRWRIPHLPYTGDRGSVCFLSPVTTSVDLATLKFSRRHGHAGDTYFLGKPGLAKNRFLGL